MIRLGGGLSRSFQPPSEFAYKVKGYRFELDKQKFRYRIEPQADELLSSWLVREALAHLADPATFVNLYLPDWRNLLWTRDIDTSSDDILLNALAAKSGISYEVLYSHTIRAYEGYLAETVNPNIRNPFIQPLKSRSRVKLGNGLRFCPKCLQEDREPYFRKKWRLSFSTACIVHNIFLLDRCPRCETSITLCRSYCGGEFPVCCKCSFELRNAGYETIEHSSFGIEAIRRLYDILDSGIFIFGNRYAYSFLFFRVLRHLTRIVRCHGAIRDLLGHEVMADKITLSVRKTGSNMIDSIPHKEQYLLFSALMDLVDSFPDRFIEFCKSRGLRNTDLTRDMLCVPYFYWQVANMFKSDVLPISSDEVMNAAQYVMKTRGSVCREWVSELMGVWIDNPNTEELRRQCNFSCTEDG